MSTGKNSTDKLLIVVFIFQFSSPMATALHWDIIEGIYKINFRFKTPISY